MAFRHKLKRVKIYCLKMQLYFDEFGDESENQYKTYRIKNNYFNDRTDDFFLKIFSKSTNRLLGNSSSIKNKKYLTIDNNKYSDSTYRSSYTYNNNLSQISSKIPLIKTRENSYKRYHKSLNKEIQFLSNAFKKKYTSTSNRPISNFQKRKSEYTINLATPLSDIKNQNKIIKINRPNFLSDYIKSNNKGKQSFDNLFEENEEIKNFRLSMRRK